MNTTDYQRNQMNAKDLALMLRHLRNKLNEAEGLLYAEEIKKALNKIKDAKDVLEGMAERIEKSSSPN
jgi:hypothetical protein